MITPYMDKDTIRAILCTDEYIQRAGFDAENIKMTKYGTDVLNTPSNELRIFIYNGTPENPNNQIQKGVVYNITVVGKRDIATKIDNVCEQIIAILDDVDLGRAHLLQLLDPPLELDSDPALYVCEIAFICYSTIYNKKKN
jgi:hypothetical protein